MEYPQVYKRSPEEARAVGETALFRESHKLNIACKKAIETAIRENFDGMHLKKECLNTVTAMTLGRILRWGAIRLCWTGLSA